MKKSFGTKVAVGGKGTVAFSGYNPKGLRNKRKAHWAKIRKMAEMAKLMKDRQGNDGIFDGDGDDNY